MHSILVSVFCPDRTGLVAAITGHLFEIGANLGDTSFAILGEGAKFAAVCDLPDSITAAEVAAGLGDLRELADGTIEVRPFGLNPSHGPLGRVTHRVTVSGGDRPGLIARLSEVFGQFGANIVTMEAQRLPETDGPHYITRFAVSLPERSAEACLATVANTAGELGLAYSAEPTA